MTKIAIRADGGFRYGMGHVVRSLAIASELRKAGAEVVFITEDDRVSLQKIRSQGFEVDVKPPDACNDAYTRRGFLCHNADVLVIDIKHYAYNAESIELWRGWHVPVVMIDPMCSGRLAASLVAYTNAHTIPPSDPVPANVLHGAEYVCMNPRIVELAKQPRLQPRTVPTVLIGTGGSDPKNIMCQVVKLLDEHDGPMMRVVMPGEAYRHEEQLLAALKASPHQYYRRAQRELDPMSTAWPTHVITTFGVSVYEWALLGVPTLSIAHSQENVWGSANFAQLGASIDGGYYKDLTPEKFRGLLGELLDPLRNWQPIKGLDGRGAERVAAEILKLAEVRV